MSNSLAFNGGVATIILEGDVDINTTSSLKDQVLGVAGVSQVDVQAHNVSYIDSSGVAILLLAKQCAEKIGASFTISSASPELVKVVQLARLETVLPVSATGTPVSPAGGTPQADDGDFSDIFDN